MKKSSNAKKSKKDGKKTFRFTATIVFGKRADGPGATVPFTVKGRDIMSFTWDEVYDEAVRIMESRYSSEDFPNMDVTAMSVVMPDGKAYPIFAEDVPKDEIQKRMKDLGVGRALILPYARYSLTPEFRAYLKLKKAGTIDFEWDEKRMKEMLDVIRGADGKRP